MFDHLVEVSEEESTLYIYRVYSDGRKELFTSTRLPDISSDLNEKKFQEFAQLLGENILLDSGIARKLFGL